MSKVEINKHYCKFPVPVKRVDETKSIFNDPIEKWCFNNIPGDHKWYSERQFSKKYRDLTAMVYFFEYEEDAAAFKLVWG